MTHGSLAGRWNDGDWGLDATSHFIPHDDIVGGKGPEGPQVQEESNQEEFPEDGTQEEQDTGSGNLKHTERPSRIVSEDAGDEGAPPER